MHIYSFIEYSCGHKLKSEVLVNDKGSKSLINCVMNVLMSPEGNDMFWNIPRMCFLFNIKSCTLIKKWHFINYTGVYLSVCFLSRFSSYFYTVLEIQGELNICFLIISLFLFMTIPHSNVNVINNYVHSLPVFCHINHAVFTPYLILLLFCPKRLVPVIKPCGIRHS